MIAASRPCGGAVAERSGRRRRGSRSAPRVCAAGGCTIPMSARSESTKRGGTSRSAAARSRHAPTCCATPRERAAQLARALHAPPRELGLGAGAHAQRGVPRTRRSPSRAGPSARAARRARRAARGGARRRPPRTPAGPTVSGRRVQSVRRSPLASRTSSSRSTSDASDGAPIPMKPAATCVSKSWVGA